MVERKICEECKGKIERKKVDYELYGISLGKFDAEVCSECGEVIFDESVSDLIEQKAKEKGLWGLEAHTKIGESGTTLDIRLPKKVIEFLKLKKGKEVWVRPESKNRLVVDVV
jgi:hypothetical protein